MAKHNKPKEDYDSLSLSNPFKQFSINSSDEQPDLPSDLVVILKKYSKKDPNTRQKAMLDLASYCCTNWSPEKSEFICSLLKTHFAKFVQDPERSIRIEALKLLSFLIEKDKQNVQSIFQTIVYSLLTCLFDPNRTVVQACNQFIVGKYFNDNAKFHAVIVKYRGKIEEDLQEALVQDCTFEETAYEASESEFMVQRRKGCAFHVFGLLLKHLEIRDILIVGGAQGLKSILLSLVSKRLPFFKKAVLTCIDNNFDLFESDRSTFASEIFPLTIKADDGIEYLGLIFKYFSIWTKDHKKETTIFQFFLNNFQIIETFLAGIDRNFLQKFAPFLWKRQGEVLPKHFFNFLHFLLCLEDENLDELMNEYYCHAAIIPTHLLCKLENRKVFDFLTGFFSLNIHRLKNISFLSWTLQEMSKYDKEATGNFLESVDFGFLRNGKIYFFLLSQYPELALKLNFDFIPLEERIDQLENFQIDGNLFKLIFPLTYEFTLEQKIQILHFVDAELLWDWKNDLFLFHQLLSHPQSSDKILAVFCKRDFLLKYFENYFDSRNHLIFEKIYLFPSEIQFLTHLLYGEPVVECTAFDIEVVKPFLLAELVYFDLLLLSKFFFNLLPDIFVEIWDFLFDQNKDLIDESVIQIALFFSSQNEQIIKDILVLESLRKRKFIYSQSKPSESLLGLLDSHRSVEDIPQELIDQLPTKNEPNSIEDFKIIFYSRCKTESCLQDLCDEFFNQLVNFVPIDPIHFSFLGKYLDLITKTACLSFQVENALLLLLNCNLENVQLKMFEIIKNKPLDKNLETFLVEPFLEANCRKKEHNLQILLLLFICPNLLVSRFWLLERILEHLFYSINLLKFTFDPAKHSCQFIFDFYLQADLRSREYVEFLLECQIFLKLLATSVSLVRDCLTGSQVGISVSSRARFLFQRYPVHLEEWIEGQQKQFKYESLGSWLKEQISPWFVREELEHVSKSSGTIPSAGPSKMSIKTVISTQLKLIQAVYRIEDVRMELTLTLPPDFPLSPVSISTGTRVGVTEKVWRAWLLSTRAVLTSGSAGKLFDALMLWKANADKRFEGVEDCTICVSIFHPTDKSLPTQQCRTCNQKFHSGCIYKWFSTSANSTCPLCRSYFY